MSKKIYEASPLKRPRATRVELDILDDQIVDILREDHPQSLRHLFCRLTDPRLTVPIEKSQLGYEKVGRQLGKLRHDGRVPYDWISDSSRSGYFITTYSDAADIVEAAAGIYRADLWRDLPVYPEVWCESRSIAGVIRQTCASYGVSLYPAGGFSSITFIYEAASAINALSAGRSIRVFYVGDFDAAGVLIDKKIEEGLRQHLRPGIEMEFVRVGITQEQIEIFDLPTKPRKKGERRAPGLAETVEAEAMPASIMRELLADAIEELLPPGHLDVVRAAEESEQTFLRRLADLTRRMTGGTADKGSTS